MLRLCSIALLLACCVLSPATAQTQAQQDRIDTLAGFLIVSPWCERLGAALTPKFDERLEPDFLVEAKAWGLPESLLKQKLAEATQRYAKSTGTDLEFASARQKTVRQLRDLRLIFVKYGDECMQASRDQLFARYLTFPANFNLETAATKAADELLEAGGLASWQTPAIQARGDLALAAGACRRVFGGERADALMRAYGRSDDVRERDYYLRQYQAGLDDTELNFNAVQCNRVIAASKAKLGR